MARHDADAAMFLVQLLCLVCQVKYVLLLVMQGVDGKQIQIQLTGFLEKNTGKFMKELWGLLLSAQDNASGVPQQFLDAKQEEMRKRKVSFQFYTSCH